MRNLHARKATPRHSLRELRTPSCAGFTLLELLVVIAVIALLVGLLLPAVQNVRESARRSDCLNHLKQIALAWQLHHDSHQQFPTGGWGGPWQGDPDRGVDAAQPGGWAYNILPFLEQSALHDLGKGLTGSAKRAATTECITTPLPIFHCSTRRAAVNYPSWKFYGHPPPYNAEDTDFCAKTDYAACAGSVTTIELTYPDSLAAGDKTFAWQDNGGFGGVCFQRSTVRIANLRDGASQTYLVAEKSLAQNAYATANSNGDHHGVFAGQVVDSLRSSHVDYPPVPDPLDTDYFRRFGSAHPGGWNAALCDGSVRKLSFDLDPVIHSRLGDRRDGGVVDDSAF